MYICEAVGMEEFSKEFETKAEACKELRSFIKRFESDYGISEEFSDVYEVDEEGYEYAFNEDFQACFVCKKPSGRKEQMLLELDRAEIGLIQYQFELQDSSTCKKHLDELRKLIAEL